MALVRRRFGPDDVEWFGGAYGVLELAGRSEVARNGIDEITAAVRRNGCRPRIILVVDYDDSETSVFADRDAGPPSPEERGLTIVGERDQAPAASDAGDGEVESSP